MPVTSDGGVAPGSVQSGNGSISASATPIALSPACSSLTIATSPGAAILYVQLNGNPADTGTDTFTIFGGGSLNYSGQALSSFSIIGASATGTYTYEAN